MTTRKYNAIKSVCMLSIYPATFDSLLKAAQEHFGDMLNSMTARQIAALLEFGYSQHRQGEMAEE